MAIRNPYSNYANNSIETASPEELTLKLYEGALKFCNQAMIALEKKDYDKSNELIIRVENVIREFQLTLDMKYEVSQNLAMMYEYIHRRLIDANIAKSTEILEEVRGLLRDLRDTWKQAMVLAKQK